MSANTVNLIVGMATPILTALLTMLVSLVYNHFGVVLAQADQQAEQLAHVTSAFTTAGGIYLTSGKPAAVRYMQVQVGPQLTSLGIMNAEHIGDIIMHRVIATSGISPAGVVTLNNAGA